MSGPTALPPDKGKTMADKIRVVSTWTEELEETTSRWFRLPAYFAKKEFDLSGFRSCAGLVPLVRRHVADDQKETYSFAAQLSFRNGHDDFASDFERGRIIKTFGGKTFFAVEEEEIWEPEKRLYLSGLPAHAELEDIKESLDEYVNFTAATRKIFHLTNDEFSGQIMLILAGFKKVPPRRVYLKSGKLKGLGFTVTARGHKKETPKAKQNKPCFCCKSFDHLVKDCPKKKGMRFRWKCTQCGFATIKCYEGSCKINVMMNNLEEFCDNNFKSIPATRAHENERSLFTEKRYMTKKRLQERVELLQQKLVNDEQKNQPALTFVFEMEIRALLRYFEETLRQVRPENGCTIGSKSLSLLEEGLEHLGERVERYTELITKEEDEDYVMPT